MKVYSIPQENKNYECAEHTKSLTRYKKSTLKNKKLNSPRESLTKVIEK